MGGSLFLIAATAASALLASFANTPEPWDKIEANSEQRQPLYIGASPRDIQIKRILKLHPELPEFMRTLGEKQAQLVRDALNEKKAEFEVWPVQNDYGQWTWAFARWRKSSEEGWQWIHLPKFKVENSKVKVPPILPQRYRSWVKNEFTRIFEDFLNFDGLYDKPVFGDCVWTTIRGSEVLGAWLPVEQINLYKNIILENQSHQKEVSAHYVCWTLPQPARFNTKPVSFVLKATTKKVHWPKELHWRSFESDHEASKVAISKITLHQSDFEQRAFEEAYQKDVLIFSGQQEAVFPLSGKRMWFERKNSADPNHQLEEMVDYLQERYHALGIQTIRQRFTWRGIPQSNLIAKIPGSLSLAENRPVILADHIDTAFCEDEFKKSAQRVSAYGADDNVSAMAALLRAAETLKEVKPQHDIWLVHLTGEEYPGDDLGARHFVQALLSSESEKRLQPHRDISGVILMDMIGYRTVKEPTFQINLGGSAESALLGWVAAEASFQVAPSLVPLIRPRFDEKSYLYNTDGLIFSDAGFPVILLNEHLNASEELEHPHYHQTTDVPANLDFSYAIAISKVAIETAAQLAVHRIHEEKSCEGWLKAKK